MSHGDGCSVRECHEDFYAKGYCKRHYNQVRRGDPLTFRVCQFPGCSGRPEGKGSWRRCPEHLTSCAVSGCTRKRYQGVHCSMHRRRLEIHGDVGSVASQVGPKKPEWWVNEAGYVVSSRRSITGPDKKMVFQHRWVMEQILGRPLLPEETVHHKNGVRHDNRRENLELWSSSHPQGQRVEDKLIWAREIISLYG